jgi:hypothetical protein
MDALGSSWLHYGVHAVPKTNLVGSGVRIVFPDYEFEPHFAWVFITLCLTLRTPKHITGLLLSPFSDPLNMKR